MPSFFDTLRGSIERARDLTTGRERRDEPITPIGDDIGIKPRQRRPGEDPDDIDDTTRIDLDFEEPEETPFGVDVPDWLRQISEEGFGQGFLRSAEQLGGTPLSERTNIASRGLREQSFLQGVSGSGFAGDKIRQLELDRGKALSKLQLGIESQNEATKRGALAQLKDIELFNEQVQQDFANMSEIEKLNALQRQFQLQAAQQQFRAQHQSTGQQLGSLGVTAGLGIAGIPGMAPVGLGIAGVGGLFSLFG